MKRVLLTAILVLMAGCSRPEADDSTSTQVTVQLVGVWRLESYTVTSSDGEIRFPFGQHPKGQIVYTDNGHMSAQLMSAAYDLDEFADLDGPATIRELGVSRFFAYWGTYTVDEEVGTVTHELEGCLYPEWVGVSQLRNFRLDNADTLVLWAQLPGVSDPGDRYELRWVRVL